MKGKYHIIIENRRIRYEFTVRRNITIIRGDSATGKTQLLEMLRAFSRQNGDSGVTLQCERPCIVLDSVQWEHSLQSLSQSIIFIDEGNTFVTSEAFARAVRSSDNYFVIIARDSLPNLAYSVDEIYGIRTSAKYAGLKKTYNELYHLYGNVPSDMLSHAEKTVIEDSNAGFSFFEAVFQNRLSCVSAGGKSSIPALVRKETDGHTMLVIADGAAFGAEMENMERLMDAGQHIALYLPESFEWSILSSGLIEDREVTEILSHPEDFIESTEYFSWEQYFTALLVQKTDGTYLKYSKRKLNPVFLQEKERNALLGAMPALKPLLE
ncbi:MAG: translation initiation factor 2 [Lachnospiraceae bacterium]|nr:translation initiation factor 2 [Lachnospiraceae bacterium]